MSVISVAGLEIIHGYRSSAHGGAISSGSKHAAKVSIEIILTKESRSLRQISLYEE